MDSNPSFSSYTLFCGVILLENNSANNRPAGLLPWTERLNGSAQFLNYLNKSYYKNFLQNINPEAAFKDGHSHFTLSSFREVPKVVTIPLQGTTLSVRIPYLDLYFFPDQVAIFTFRADLDQTQASYENVSKVVNHLRQTGSQINLNDVQVSVADFIRQSLNSVVVLRSDWDQYLPQLKSYTIINDSSVKAFDDSLDRTLYELSHVLPIGSSRNSEFTPTAEYLSQVMSKTIAVYNNWKALPLFDTFTRVSCSYPDQYNAWEQEYFLIYIHGLYAKYQLYSFNGRLNEVSTISRQTKLLRNRFVDFVQHYHLAYISYKFLPNLIYEKVNESLEIQKELDRMESKLERIHEAYGERKSLQMNQLLLVISLLSILSVVTDLSAWLTQMGLPPGVVYSPYSPIVLIIGILGAGFWIYKRRVG